MFVFRMLCEGKAEFTALLLTKNTISKDMIICAVWMSLTSNLKQLSSIFWWFIVISHDTDNFRQLMNLIMIDRYLNFIFKVD